MSLTQIKRNVKIRRMNQIPIYNLYITNVIENISEINKKDETIQIVQSIVYDMIDLIETNHNFVCIQSKDIPKKKNIFKQLLNATKKLIYKM